MTGTEVATYEFHLAAHLDEHWSDWFGNLTVAHRDDGTCTLRGPVADQAQLHGILDRIRDLGVTLLGVHRLDRDAARWPTDGPTLC